jgi:hypothetical protein
MCYYNSSAVVQPQHGLRQRKILYSPSRRGWRAGWPVRTGNVCIDGSTSSHFPLQRRLTVDRKRPQCSSPPLQSRQTAAAAAAWTWAGDERPSGSIAEAKAVDYVTWPVQSVFAPRSVWCHATRQVGERKSGTILLYIVRPRRVAVFCYANYDDKHQNIITVSQSSYSVRT